MLAGTLATVLAVLALTGSLQPERVRDWVDGFGLLGPVAFVLVSSLLTVALFPGPLLAGASGLLFGTALGTPLSIIAATLGASLAFSLSRWWAHDAVLALAGRRLLALRDWVGRRGFLSVLYARLAPGVPYNLVNYAAGLTPIALRTFAAATAVGVAPRAFAYTALGGSFGRPRVARGDHRRVRDRDDGDHRAGARPPRSQSCWTWTRLVVPGRPLGSPAVTPTRWPGRHQPSSTTRRAASAMSSSVVSLRFIDAACTPHMSPQRRTVSRPGDSA